MTYRMAAKIRERQSRRAEAQPVKRRPRQSAYVGRLVCTWGCGQTWGLTGHSGIDGARAMEQHIHERECEVQHVQD